MSNFGDKEVEYKPFTKLSLKELTVLDFVCLFVFVGERVGRWCVCVFSDFSFLLMERVRCVYMKYVPIGKWPIDPNETRIQSGTPLSNSRRVL